MRGARFPGSDMRSPKRTPEQIAAWYASQLADRAAQIRNLRDAASVLAQNPHTAHIATSMREQADHMERT